MVSAKLFKGLDIAQPYQEIPSSNLQSGLVYTLKISLMYNSVTVSQNIEFPVRDIETI